MLPPLPAGTTPSTVDSPHPDTEPIIEGTIVLLIYHFDPDDSRRPLLADIIGRHAGVYLPFDMYLRQPLQSIFSRVVVYDYLRRRAEVGLKAMNQEIIALVRQERPKYVLWTAWRYDVHPSTMQAVRREGAATVGLFFDDEWRFEDYSQWWTPYLDYCITNHLAAMPKYRALGSKVVRLIPNTGVAAASDANDVVPKYDVSFVGTRGMADRGQWVDELARNGIQAHCFGHGWGSGYVTFENMLDIFRSSRINLSFSQALADGGLQLKGRVYQACMVGGFVLSQYVPDLESFFEPDKEIVCFRTPEEMIAKIGYYLAHEDERKAIARAGWLRASREYTSVSLVSKVFREIEALAATPRQAPVRRRMPLWARAPGCEYHVEWGRLLAEHNELGAGRDDLAAAIRYAPFDLSPWYLLVATFAPLPLRRAMLKFGSSAGTALSRMRRKIVARIRTAP